MEGGGKEGGERKEGNVGKNGGGEGEDRREGRRGNIGSEVIKGRSVRCPE